MSAFETAGRWSTRAFPVEWGQPLGTQYSEQRADWIRAKVGEHAALTAHAKLASKAGRLLSILRSADLTARREPPSGPDAAA